MAISSGCFCGGETGDDRTNEAKHTIERSVNTFKAGSINDRSSVLQSIPSA